MSEFLVAHIDETEFEGCSDCREAPEAVPPGSAVSVEPFTVKDILAVESGKHGGCEDSFLCLGTLRDGRHFFVSSWEDYSGHG